MTQKRTVFLLALAALAILTQRSCYAQKESINPGDATNPKSVPNGPLSKKVREAGKSDSPVERKPDSNPSDSESKDNEEDETEILTTIKDVTLRDRDGKVIYRGAIDLSKTISRIKKGEKLDRFGNDGIVFQNREGRLPRKPKGYYHEFVHPTEKQGGPGPQRIVTGENGEFWYTHDHYRSFKRLDKPKK